MSFFRAVIYLLIRSKIYQYIAYQRMAGNQLKNKVEISYDPAAPETITVSYPGYEPFTAQPIRIGEYCDKRPVLPASMQKQKPSTSRFLDALENRHAQTQRQMADAISFASYRKEANDHV